MTDIALLIHRYLKEELNEEERQELESWKQQSDANRRVFERLTDDNYLLQAVADDYKIDSPEVARRKIHLLIGADQQGTEKAEEIKTAKIKSIWPKLSVAAAFLCLLALSSVYIMRRNNRQDTEVSKLPNVNSDITPGTNRATLKLADGKSIVLDSAMKGQLAQQGGTQVFNKNGQLVYTAGAGVHSNKALWNTLSTAKGQTYPLLLSDGTRVTLNSESSISFPVAFTGDVREVKVIGEVFFEVIHNANRPFKVTARDMELQDLGTSFNVNAYTDEGAVKATLIEGSILIKKGIGIERKIIKPGQMAEVLPDEIKVTETNIDKVTAWKRGLFLFTDDKLSVAMKNISRWYDIDVVFEGSAKDIDVSGTISRSANLSELLQILAEINVDAKVEGRKLILKVK